MPNLASGRRRPPRPSTTSASHDDDGVAAAERAAEAMRCAAENRAAAEGSGARRSGKCAHRPVARVKITPRLPTAAVTEGAGTAVSWVCVTAATGCGERP
ncbi:hypothetical protein BU14_0300s0012 [Porphyra umbilicalis]|uniref:Uncharacterized protein n=1 Tax=Porphyra umbilicalis TaxID=2786 RepID=A0A1X6P0A9_PORUM|nr:hypothetical protein BU14_0300s0012 [Porphyra umbilicalis]|eukprot:OSX74215.1 hypothetical protein BU14_0300s0012 [Porphyra umbilicalis]